MKLDMRFADDEDAGDIECVLEIADSSEYDENSHFYCRLANAQRPGAATKLNVRVNKAQIVQDCNTSHTQWIVMETAVPEEQVVGAARLLLGRLFDAGDGGGPKTAVVDMLACIPDTQQQSVRSQMLAQLERVAVGQGAEVLVVEVVQHRTDTQEWLETCGYEELGGRACEEDGLIKATMVFEFHKNLRNARAISVGTFSAIPVSASAAAAAREGNMPTKVEPPAPAPESVFAMDLASLTLEDFEIVSSSAEPKNSAVGVRAGARAGARAPPSAAIDPMRSAISDLFSALHREHSDGH